MKCEECKKDTSTFQPYYNKKGVMKMFTCIECVSKKKLRKIRGNKNWKMNTALKKK